MTGRQNRRHRVGIEPRKAMKQKKGFIPEYAGLPVQESVTVSSRWYEKLQGRCYLLDKFREGKYLDYNERLSLFSNLRYLSYNTKARTVLEDVLSWYQPQTYAGHTCDEGQIRAKFRDCTLKPVPIVRGRGGKLVTVPEFFGDDIDIPITPQCSKVTMQELDAWMEQRSCLCCLVEQWRCPSRKPVFHQCDACCRGCRHRKNNGNGQVWTGHFLYGYRQQP